MAICTDGEALAPSASSSFHRRLIHSAAAVVAPDTVVNSSTESKGGDMKLDADSRYRVVSRTNGGEEERSEETVMNGGGECRDGVGKSEGEFPAKFVFRASALAHWRVKESPLSSDTIFTQSHAGH